jgi:glycosyltransferase involved in cell wall biosynthesis
MRVLFVSPYVPSPIRVRPYQWIRALAKHGHRIHLIALQPPEDRWVGDPPVRGCCERATVFPLGRVRTLVNAAAAVPRDLPLQAAYSAHAEAERFVASEAALCDIVHVEHFRGSRLARHVRGTPCVIDAVDSITALFEQAVRHAPAWQQRLIARLDLARTRRFEAALPLSFERTIVSSARDAAMLRRLSGVQASDRIVTVPNGVDLEYFRPAQNVDQANTVLFTGKMSYHANEAAALRLGERLMPLIWQLCPEARLVIAGKDPSTSVRRLAQDPRVTVTGYVDDLRPFFAKAAVVIAPLEYATGIQNKVLEAMACGVPVVASPAACDGIQATPARDLLVGHDDGELAHHAVALLRSQSYRTEIGLSGRRFVAKHHDWFEMAGRVGAVYEAACAGHRRCA